MAGATRTQVYLTPEQRARIDALRARTGQSLAEVVRAALDDYLERHPGDPPTLEELIASGRVRPPRDTGPPRPPPEPVKPKDGRTSEEVLAEMRRERF